MEKTSLSYQLPPTDWKTMSKKWKDLRWAIIISLLITYLHKKNLLSSPPAEDMLVDQSLKHNRDNDDDEGFQIANYKSKASKKAEENLSAIDNNPDSVAGTSADSLKKGKESHPFSEKQ